MAGTQRPLLSHPPLYAIKKQWWELMKPQSHHTAIQLARMLFAWVPTNMPLTEQEKWTPASHCPLITEGSVPSRVGLEQSSSPRIRNGKRCSSEWHITMWVKVVKCIALLLFICKPILYLWLSTHKPKTQQNPKEKENTVSQKETYTYLNLKF
jgi:hypothetical protein